MKIKKEVIICLILSLFIIQIITAGEIPIGLKPKINGILQPNTVFNFNISLSNTQECDDINISQTQDVKIGTDGIGNMSLTLKDNLGGNPIPKWVCMYRNSTLIETIPFASQIFNKTFHVNLETTNIDLVDLLRHKDDADTYINFNNNQIVFTAGGINYIDLRSGAIDIGTPILLNNFNISEAEAILGTNQEILFEDNYLRLQGTEGTYNHFMDFYFDTYDTKIWVDFDASITGIEFSGIDIILTAGETITDGTNSATASQMKQSWDHTFSTGAGHTYIDQSLKTTDQVSFLGISATNFFSAADDIEVYFGDGSDTTFSFNQSDMVNKVSAGYFNYYLNTYKYLYFPNISIESEVIINSTETLTGNYSTGPCWQYFQQGLLTNTNCSAI